MDEKRTPVKPVQVDAQCEKCGGTMLRDMDGNGNTFWPKWYECVKCGHREQSEKDYPRIEYVQA